MGCDWGTDVHFLFTNAGMQAQQALDVIRQRKRWLAPQQQSSQLDAAHDQDLAIGEMSGSLMLP